jgi:hypothetical protein
LLNSTREATCVYVSFEVLLQPRQQNATAARDSSNDAKKTVWGELSLIVEFNSFRATKYLVVPAKVTSLIEANNILVAGTKDGSVHFFDLRESDL